MEHFSGFLLKALLRCSIVAGGVTELSRGVVGVVAAVVGVRGCWGLGKEPIAWPVKFTIRRIKVAV